MTLLPPQRRQISPSRSREGREGVAFARAAKPRAGDPPSWCERVITEPSSAGAGRQLSRSFASHRPLRKAAPGSIASGTTSTSAAANRTGTRLSART